MAKRMVRKHRSEQQWRELIAEQAGSGLSVLGWCRKRGICQSAFYRWRGRCGGAGQTKAPFVAVQVLAEPASSIEILLGSGRRIRLTGSVDRHQLAEVLAVLEEPAC